MNSSSSFAENLLLSPLLRQRDFSPILSPFPEHTRKFSQDLQELVEFNLEMTPVQPCDAPIQGLEEPQQLSQHPCPPDSPEAVPPSPQQPPASTKLEQASEESSVMGQISLQEDSSAIQALINYLITHSKMPEERISVQANRLFPSQPELQEVFGILARKFRRLRKTKEEMVKYCIRKAFKYVTELSKKSSKIRDLDCSMRQYFAEEGGCSFSIPFKKNSQEKTMNGCFLRRIFACPKFTEDYARFVIHFRELMLQDNRKKVSYLAQLITQAVAEEAPSKVEKIKRLPWTIDILEETNQLAIGLAQSKGEGIGRRNKRV